jgi:hypothetical protein
VLPSLLVLMLACGMAEKEYSTRRGVVECRKIEKCALGLYEYEYEADFDLCVDGIGDRLDGIAGEQLSECDYDPAEGKRCLSRIRRMTCEEFVRRGPGSACDQVYDCTGVSLGPGGSGTGGTIGTEPTTGGGTGGATATGSGTGGTATGGG